MSLYKIGQSFFFVVLSFYLTERDDTWRIALTALAAIPLGIALEERYKDYLN